MLRLSKNISLVVIFFVLFIPTVSAQEETVLVTASGFGGTRDKALEQAGYHALVRLAEKHFASQKEFAAQNEKIREFLQENVNNFIEDLTDAKIINKFRRNKLTARIPVRETELINALKENFPDLAP